MPGPDKQFDTEIALERAMQLFWAHGYDGTSISQLMSEMGIGKKSLYDTFGNKRSIFLKSVQRYTDTQVAQIRTGLQAEGSPLANLRAFLRNLQSRHSEPNSHGCLLGTCMADFDTDDAEVAEVLRRSLRSVENVFTEALQRAKNAGELSAESNPRELARMLVCLVQGMALVGRVLDTGTFPSSSVRAAIDLLERA